MSRRAVSCEHFASLAHLDVVSLPSNPFSKRLTISRSGSRGERVRAVFFSDMRESCYYTWARYFRAFTQECQDSCFHTWTRVFRAFTQCEAHRAFAHENSCVCPQFFVLSHSGRPKKRAPPQRLILKSSLVTQTLTSFNTWASSGKKQKPLQTEPATFNEPGEVLIPRSVFGQVRENSLLRYSCRDISTGMVRFASRGSKPHTTPRETTMLQCHPSRSLTYSCEWQSSVADPLLCAQHRRISDTDIDLPSSSEKTGIGGPND